MERKNENRKEEGIGMNCIDCNRPSTQFHPYMLCTYCWTERYSTQLVGGVHIPFKILLKEVLKRKDLWYKEGESVEEWYDRCAKWGKKGYETTIGKVKGQETTAMGKGLPDN